MLDGGGFAQVTSGAGESPVALSLDGQTLFFWKIEDFTSLWKMTLPAGPPAKFPEVLVGIYGYSLDGRQLLVSVMREEGGRQRERLEVRAVEGGDVIRSISPPENAYGWRWDWAGGALTYLREADGTVNIWRLPLAGGEPRQLTDFKDDELASYAWTADGARVFFARSKTISRDIVLITNFR